jgi:protein-disulfide isomerase
MPITPTRSVPNNPISASVNPGHILLLGQPNAPVKIVMFSDLQSPFGWKFYQEILPQLKKDYIDTGQASLYFRHYPILIAGHALSEGLECAQMQDKAYEYYQIVTETLQSLPNAESTNITLTDIKSWLTKSSLEQKSFGHCIDAGYTTTSQITFDKQEGTKVGVSGVPTFFIGKKMIVGAQDYSMYKKLIDTTLLPLSPPPGHPEPN